MIKFSWVLLALVAALSVVVVAAAVYIVSNIVTVGTQLILSKPVVGITLTLTDTLPAQMERGKEERIRWDIRSIADYPATTLKFSVESTSPLNDTSILAATFRHPDTGNQTQVTFTASGGLLVADLAQNWAVSNGYAKSAEMRLRFSDSAPVQDYQAKLWVQVDDGTAPPTGKVVDVAANDALRFVPQDVTIQVGDAVRWTNTGTTPHTITFADASIPDRSLLEGGQIYTVVFSQLGSYSYLCQFHSGMVGSVLVQ